MNMAESMQASPAVDSWSRGRLQQVRVCPACGKSSAVSAEYARRDDALVMPDIWHVVRCAACRSLYLNPRPDAESLPRAYADYYTHNPESDELASGAARGLIAALVNGYLNSRFHMRRQPAMRAGAWLFGAIPPLRMRLNVYGRHVPRSRCNAGTRVLDVGCGNGAFLLRAREMGMRAHGCEPDSAAVATCRALGLDVTQGEVFDAGYDAGSFDLITLNHVIEHVTDQPRLLAKLHALLVPGGMLWLALPNPDALGVRVFAKGWKGLHPPFHLAIPSQVVLRQNLHTCGFLRIHMLRRGAQSPGMWRESTELAQRERTVPPKIWLTVMRRFADVLATLSPRWSEETIAVAWKPE